MKKQRGFERGARRCCRRVGHPTAPTTASNAPSAKASSIASAIVRPEPDALVRSAKGYASEARAQGTLKVYSKH
jgi:hypothetical protein